MQDPMSFGITSEKFNKETKSPFVRLKPKLKKTALDRKKEKVSNNEIEMPLKDLVISVDGTVSQIDESHTYDNAK